jgi:NADH-quinone oxidoreductase subunit L
MVTAGVYMVARLSPLFLLAPLTLHIIAVVGAVTALMAGSIAIAQTDIKRVLAYSTVSQLGFMFLALGVGAFAVGVFHLLTHAFFKALLFLGAGSVIHGMADRQDMREMGGLRRSMPVTHLTMLAGGLALAGVPFFSGFFSKDEILYEAWAGPLGTPVLWAVGAVAALLTGIYTFRLFYLTFYGGSRVPEEVGVNESPPVMTVPLALLAVGAVLAGYVGLPELLGGGAWLQGFLGGALGGGHGAGAVAAETAHSGGGSLQTILMAASVVIVAVGFLVARRWYGRPEPLPEAPAEAAPGLWRVLRHKYYFDEFYFLFVVRPLNGAAKWCYRIFDVEGIDGSVRSVADAVAMLSRGVRRLQQGNVAGYAFTLAIGAIVLLAWLLG